MAAYRSEHSFSFVFSTPRSNYHDNLYFNFMLHFVVHVATFQYFVLHERERMLHHAMHSVTTPTVVIFTAKCRKHGIIST